MLSNQSSGVPMSSAHSVGLKLLQNVVNNLIRNRFLILEDAFIPSDPNVPCLNQRKVKESSFFANPHALLLPEGAIIPVDSALECHAETPDNLLSKPAVRKEVVDRFGVCKA